MLKLLFTVLTLLFIQLPLVGQTPIFTNVQVDDNTFLGSIGDANSTRNVAVAPDGTIHVVYARPSALWVTRSTDRGESFTPSITIPNSVGTIPEILHFSKSVDGGVTFSESVLVGPGVGLSGHMSVSGSNVYIVDQSGGTAYVSKTNGDGGFVSQGLVNTFIDADVHTDQNGRVFIVGANPSLRLFQSVNEGDSFEDRSINPGGDIFFPSSTLSEGPCGSFLIVGGGGSSPFNNQGYKINLDTGESTSITLGNNELTPEGRALFADDSGLVIDSYRGDDGNLYMRISYDQGTTFRTPINIGPGESHNIAVNPSTNDIVVVFEEAGDVFVSVYSNSGTGLSINTPSTPLICPGGSFDLSVNMTGFPADILLNVELSDPTGNFQNSTIIGSINSSTDTDVPCTLPANIPSSANYRVKVSAPNQCLQSNEIVLEIDAITILQQGKQNICIPSGEPIQVNLGELASLIGNDRTGQGITFHNTEEQALNGTDALADNFTPNSNPLTIYARVENNTSQDCFGVVPQELEFFPEPIANEINDWEKCLEENSVIFNLSTRNPELIGNQDPSFLSISYHESEIDARAGANEITSVTLNGGQSTQVFARIQSNINEECADVTSFAISTEDQQSFDVPTSFIPNNNGVNDVFQPLSRSFCGSLPTSYKLEVWNKWGELVFSSSDINRGWEGEGVEAGTYFWIITYAFNRTQVFGFGHYIIILYFINHCFSVT